MIEKELEFDLPTPWVNCKFKIARFGAICFLVGPNGSGKSRFAQRLKDVLGNTRLLGTDRLNFMSVELGGIYGDRFSDGFPKAYFSQYKGIGANFGSAIDTFIILAERPEIRLRIEATLSSLFSRTIRLDWDSGNLVPYVLHTTGNSYRLDREECHGIRELLVLLTHLYDDQQQYLIIDEPELNLHPQYQAFLLQEVRKIAAIPHVGSSRKGVFIITHSPFMIDLRSFDDLASIISFSADHTVPKIMLDTTEAARAKFSPMLSRLSVHHKQLFFSDNPIFVEGILDAMFIEAFQQRRNKSITAAGSCIIDVGGKEEVTKYIELCQQFGKKAYFVYDLDSLFFGNLKQCIKNDGTIVEFLAQLGVGQDFGKYCGEFEKALTIMIDKVINTQDPALAELRNYVLTLDVKSNPKDFAKARVAFLIEMAHRRENMILNVGKKDIIDLEGRLKKITDTLATKNIILIPGGALENYLPSYNGNRFELEESLKVKAVDSEIQLLSTGALDHELDTRYGELLTCIRKLPASEPVDMDSALQAYAADYIHKLQGAIVQYPGWDQEHINVHMLASGDGLGRLFTVTKLTRSNSHEFKATVSVTGDKRIIKISDKTNAGMRDFTLEADAATSTHTP